MLSTFERLGYCRYRRCRHSPGCRVAHRGDNASLHDQLFVNQHAYGLPAAHAPVFCFRASDNGDMLTPYISSFERIWIKANP